MIQSRVIHNCSCLKCNNIAKHMIKIGVFVMCRKCFENEFNIDEINPDSKMGKKYYKWLKIHKEKEDY